MVPTAELTLDGTRATAVIGERDGVKHITPMLAITRTWNSVCAASGMRPRVSLAERRASSDGPVSIPRAVTTDAPVSTTFRVVLPRSYPESGGES